MNGDVLMTMLCWLAALVITGVGLMALIYIIQLLRWLWSQLTP